MKWMFSRQIPKLNQDHLNYLNSPLTPKELEVLIKRLPTKKKKKNPWPHGFSTEFYQTFKENLILILLKLFHKTETEVTLPNTFHEGTFTLILKPQKDPTKRTSDQFPS